MENLEFLEGDLVWTHIRKDRFPQGKFSKLKPRVNGPFKILEKIVENAYKIELPKEYDICQTFNVKDLKPYHGEKTNANMWTSFFSQPQGNDVWVSNLVENSKFGIFKPRDKFGNLVFKFGKFPNWEFPKWCRFPN